MQLWKILNIKSNGKWKHLRDVMCDPFRSTNDSHFAVLNKTVSWLEHWDTVNFSLKGRRGKLSNTTHLAVTHTLKTFSVIIEYLLNTEKFNYVLPGKF